VLMRLMDVMRSAIVMNLVLALAATQASALTVFVPTDASEGRLVVADDLAAKLTQMTGEEVPVAASDAGGELPAGPKVLLG